jgi:hypothetical protein
MNQLIAWVRRSTAKQGISEKAEDLEAILGLTGLVRSLRLRRPNSKRWEAYSDKQNHRSNE